MSPIEEVMWDPNYFGPNSGAWVGGFLGDPAEPIDNFELGVTEPTASNTGFRVPEISLSNYSGDITNITQGQIVSKLAITGKVKPGATITATMQDCLLLGQTQAGATGNSYYNIGDQTGTTTSGAGLMTWEFCEIRASIPSYKNNGWKGGNVFLYRCKGSTLTDFLSPHGSSGSGVSKIFKAHGCYADGFYTDADPNQTSDNITHNDFCQCQGLLSTLEIIGCANGDTGRPRTSFLLVQKGEGGYGTVKIGNNWIRGATGTGSSINIASNMLASDFQEFHLYGNRVSTTGKTPRALVSASVRTGFASTIFGNIEMETGLPLTINNA